MYNNPCVQYTTYNLHQIHVYYIKKLISNVISYNLEETKLNLDIDN